MAYPGKIDTDALALALLAGQTIEQLAVTFGSSTRTVRRRIAEERARHTPEWPIKRPTVKRKDKPEPAPVARSRPAAAPGAEATPDEIEAFALAVYVDEASSVDSKSQDRIAAARALVELADRRRLRRPPGADQTTDPAEAAAAIRLEIERATANVLTVEKSTDGVSIPVADVRALD